MLGKDWYGVKLLRPDARPVKIIESAKERGEAVSSKKKKKKLAAKKSLHDQLIIMTQQLEMKARHVRNADYWNAPVGTPLPLATTHGVSLSQCVDQMSSSRPSLLGNYIGTPGGKALASAYTFESDGMSLVPDKISMKRDKQGTTITVRSDLLIDGKPVRWPWRGATYSLTIPNDGPPIAHIDLIQLPRQAQGHGFVSQYNRHMEDWYVSNGVREVRLTANVDVGGYAWARSGYDWSPDQPAPYTAILDSAEQIALQVDGKTRAKVQNDISGLRKRFEKYPPTHARYPTPYEVSNIGYQPGVDTWPGREAMLNSAWEAVKVLPTTPKGA